MVIFVVLACLPIVGAVSVWVYAVAAEPGSDAEADEDGAEGELVRGPSTPIPWVAVTGTKRSTVAAARTP